MHLERGSAAGVRFLAAIKEGSGLKASARAVGVGKETGYRWLRESFFALREQGLGLESVQVELGYSSPLFTRWDQRFPLGEEPGHHLRIQAQVEQAFWDRFLASGSLEAARRGRSGLPGPLRAPRSAEVEEVLLLAEAYDSIGERGSDHMNLFQVRDAAGLQDLSVFRKWTPSRARCQRRHRCNQSPRFSSQASALQSGGHHSVDEWVGSGGSSAVRRPSMIV